VLEEVSQSVSQDLQLQQRIRQGDNAAFAELYAGYKQGVYLYCTRFLGDQPAAEDIFQEVFLNLLERVRGGGEIENVQHYLLRSARNRCLNVIRDRKYPKDVSELEEFLPGAENVVPGEYDDLERALQELPAVKQGRVAVVSGKLLLSTSHRGALAADSLLRKLHSDCR